jgi:hypothetical protein
MKLLLILALVSALAIWLVHWGAGKVKPED